MVRDRIFLSIFASIIIVVQVVFWCFPKQEISEKEKRTLSQPPHFSISRILDGRWMQQSETYFLDHFPFRETWIGIHAWMRQTQGLNATNEIYRGKEGWLIEAPIEKNLLFEKNVQALSKFIDKTDLPASCIFVPTKGGVEVEYLPSLHLPYPDKEMFDLLMQMLPVHDIWNTFMQSDAQLYYRTDHHWTTQGAYLAYQTWCAETGRIAIPPEQFIQTTIENFYGTSYSKSGLWGIAPDTLTVWQSSENVQVTIWEGEQMRTSDSLFFWEHMQETDKYPIFLDGNHGRVRIQTEHTGKRLLILRDSFAHCFVPFLVPHYEQIDLIDVRYFKEMTISEYLAENPADEILLCYGLDTLANDMSVSQIK